LGRLRLGHCRGHQTATCQCSSLPLGGHAAAVWRQRSDSGWHLPKLPDTAVAYSLNVSVVPSGPLGYLTIWPTGEYRPGVATLNSLDGRIKADAAIVS